MQFPNLSQTQAKPAPFNPGKLIAWVAGIIFALIVIFNCTQSVGYGNVGFYQTFGSLSATPLSPGLHFKWPFIQNIVSVDTRVTKTSADATASSSDLQVVQSNIAVNYFISASDAYKLLNNIGPDYEAKVIDPHIQETFKAVTAKYTAQDLIDKRNEVASSTADDLTKVLSGYDINVKDISIVNFSFSSDYQKAVEDKQVAAQKALTAQNTLDQAKVDAQQQVVTAQAAAQAAKTTADANLYVAEQQAKGNKDLAASVTNQLINYDFVQKIDKGVLPQYWGGGSLLNIVPGASSSDSSK